LNKNKLFFKQIKENKKLLLTKNGERVYNKNIRIDALDPIKGEAAPKERNFDFHNSITNNGTHFSCAKGSALFVWSEVLNFWK